MSEEQEKKVVWVERGSELFLHSLASVLHEDLSKLCKTVEMWKNNYHGGITYHNFIHNVQQTINNHDWSNMEGESSTDKWKRFRKTYESYKGGRVDYE